jgi:hypothetical protein
VGKGDVDIHAVLNYIIITTEDNGEGELGSVDGEEPLGGIHVSLYTVGLEVLIEIKHIFLYVDIHDIVDIHEFASYDESTLYI